MFKRIITGVVAILAIVAGSLGVQPTPVSADEDPLLRTPPTRSWSDFFDWSADEVGTTLGIGFRKQDDGSGIRIESNRLQASGQVVQMHATCYAAVRMHISSTVHSGWDATRSWGAEPCYEVNDMELPGPDTGGLLVTFEAVACMDNGAHQFLTATWRLENSIPYAQTIRRDRFTWRDAPC